MFMNSVSNSDSEQCTESKLSRVHQVHTQQTLATRTQCPGCTHSTVLQASSALSRARPTVTWPCPAVSRPPPGALRPTCLLSLLCACLGCCVPAQSTVCLLRLLCACSVCCVPAQPAVCLLSILCACSACCVPAQPAVCHNTAEPAICLLSLLCATIQPAVL